jgi:RNA polymerase sigma-70 factor (ECF subfamily)
MDDTPSAELVSRAVAGDRAALEVLLARYYERLRTRIESRIPADLRAVLAADDILQEAFVDVFRGIEGFEDRGENAFEAWVGRIAENRLLDAIKAQRAAKRGGDRLIRPQGGRGDDELIDLLMAAAATERSPSRAMAGAEAIAEIRTALATLKEEYREALRLRFIEGRAMGDVAAAMGKTEPAVQKLCRRGLDALRDTLGTSSKFFTRK